MQYINLDQLVQSCWEILLIPRERGFLSYWTFTLCFYFLIFINGQLACPIAGGGPSGGNLNGALNSTHVYHILLFYVSGEKLVIKIWFSQVFCSMMGNVLFWILTIRNMKHEIRVLEVHNSK